MTPTHQLLEEHGIKASAQRLAVAEYVLNATSHPTAERVLVEARKRCPMVSRATVYNTLNLLTQRGLLRQLPLGDNRVVFDPNVGPHHHFIDDRSGAIVDLPWSMLDVVPRQLPSDIRVREYEVVIRGERRKP